MHKIQDLDKKKKERSSQFYGLRNYDTVLVSNILKFIGTKNFAMYWYLWTINPRKKVVELC